MTNWLEVIKKTVKEKNNLEGIKMQTEKSEKSFKN